MSCKSAKAIKCRYLQPCEWFALNQIKIVTMRKLEKLVDVAFIGLFTLAFAYAVVMLATGQFHISHTGMG